jgi:bacillithiol biosynthesis cysteine-adding enzyme BshC
MYQKQTIPFEKTSLFSKLFIDYLNQHPNIKPYYHHHFHQQDFKNFIDENPFSSLDRNTLVKSLLDQSHSVANTSELSLNAIQSLAQTNTYTVTTGHQLCLFTGPLYFIYKIISTINLAKQLSQSFPDKKFVPVYWMASEDHDFEEINHVHVFGKKIQWNSEQKGSVGEFDTHNINSAINELRTVLGSLPYTDELIQLFEKAYTSHSNLSLATRYLVNEWFGEYGLVLIDGNDKQLKSLFVSEMQTDAFKQSSFTAVNQSIEELKALYSIQVNPREINLFYKDKQLRERIEKKNETFQVLNSDVSFSENELKSAIETTPEKFSPNVVLRPLYQQKILPNIAYVGGPGELAYWLEYKKLFEVYALPMPVLVPRNFAMLIDKGSLQKITKLNLSIEDVFTDGENLVKKIIKTQHAEVNLEDFKSKLTSMFADMNVVVSEVDKTLASTVDAEKQKTLNGIAGIEQKINRALKQKSETEINQLWSIKQKLFPNNIPQERYDNVSMYYAKYGKAFITEMMAALTSELEDFNYVVLTES